MASEEIAGLLQQLGDAMIARSDHKQNPVHLFLCAEVVPGMISPALYQLYSNNIRYIDTGKYIGNIVYDLWRAVEEDKIWRGIFFEIVDRSFTVSFDYPDGPYPPDPDEEDDENGMTTFEAKDARMMAALRARFGDKPIIYPTDEETVRQTMLDDAAHSVDFNLEPPSSG